VKKIAGGKVEGFYHLVEGPECRAQVEKLIQSYTYIYPIKEVSLKSISITIFISYEQGRGLIIRTKPFNHPAIISILRELFFGNTRRPLAEQHRNRFTSMPGTHGEEPEIPAAALALVVTCVLFYYYLVLLSCLTHLFQIHSAIDDYSSGVCKKTDFNADLYKDVYKSHIEALEHIKTASATKYHRLMADLYTHASYVIICHCFASC
jgi:hypothetical protein